MLPRVSAALSQFIKPISSSSQQQAVTEKKYKEEKSDFQPFQQDNKKSKLKLVSTPEKVQTEGSPQSPLTHVTPPAPRNLSVAHSFLQLLASLQKKQTVLTYLRGVQIYLSSTKNNRKLKRLRKGTIIDERLE